MFSFKPSSFLCCKGRVSRVLFPRKQTENEKRFESVLEINTTKGEGRLTKTPGRGRRIKWNSFNGSPS
jgi:hypothetical protein